MHQPTLSVIMPNYNHSLFLHQALQNILDQSFRPIEIIVIDDGSTDNSVEVIEGFVQKDPIVRLVRNDQNRGVIFSANRGLQLASGKYIYFAAADDLILPGLFEQSMSLLDKYPQAGLSSAMVEVRDIDGTGCVLPLEDISSKDCFLSPAECIKLLRQQESWMGGNTTIFRRQALIEASGLIPELGAFCDVFAEMVIALRHGVCFIPTRLSVMRPQPSSYSASFWSDYEIALNIYSYAAHLMLSTYKELFPPDFVSAWKKQKIHHIRLSSLKKLHRQEMRVVRSFFTRENLMDQLIIRGMQIVMQVQFLAFTSYLFMRLTKEFRNVVTRGARIRIRRLSRKLSSGYKVF